MRRRREKARVDTPEQRESITQARRAAFMGKSLAGKSVQRHISASSLNPIHVSPRLLQVISWRFVTNWRIIECLLYQVRRVRCEFLRDVRTGLDARIRVGRMEGNLPSRHVYA